MFYFVSYSSVDKNIAEKIITILIKLDIKCWNDQAEIEPGDDMKSKIKSAIGETTGAIIIISKNYFKEKNNIEWCVFELKEIFKKSNYKIVPILLDDVEEISGNTNKKYKNLVKKISQIRGFNVKNNQVYNDFRDYMKSLKKNNNGYFIDKKSDYYLYWGTEYGTLRKFRNDNNYYYNIDLVHSDKERKYVVIGKIEIISPIIYGEIENVENFKDYVPNILSNYIKNNRETFKIIFKDSTVIRKDFEFSLNNRSYHARYIGRVNGLYPYGKDIYIDYSQCIPTFLENNYNKE